MDLVSSFAVWLQPLSIALTTPSFHNFALILTGCVFARRRTLTGILIPCGIKCESQTEAFVILAFARLALRADPLVRRLNQQYDRRPRCAAHALRGRPRLGR
jgi:hypothetical protein